MKTLLGILVVLIASVAVALTAREDPGYILVTRGDWTVETTLTLFIVAAALLFIAAYLLVRLAANTASMPRRVRSWRQRRRELKARRSTRKGLIELAEGRWRSAEKHLVHYADFGDAPLLNYLGAARAAQKQGAEKRRDHYLFLAHQAMPDAELAVGLTQAEVQISQGQWEQALATLMHLRAIAPKNAHVLTLLKRLYERLNTWSDLLELVPALRKHKVLDEEQINAIEKKAHRELLAQAGGTGRLDQLRETWMQIPKHLRQDPEMIGDYVQRLIQIGQGGEAERLLRDALRQQWEPSLVRLYGEVEGDDQARQLTLAESWLKGHERHPDLLLTLGRLAARNQLWGKARSYLEASAGAEPRPETFRELGELLEQMGEQEEARHCFRRGLNMAAGTGKGLLAVSAPARS